MAANDTNRLKDRLINHSERALRERADEKNRDEKGTPKSLIHDPNNNLTDVHGRRKYRPGTGMSPRQLAEKLDEETPDPIEPRGGHPSDQRDDTEDSEDVPEYIATFADSEGW